MKKFIKLLTIALCLTLGAAAFTACKPGGAKFNAEGSMTVLVREEGSGTRDAFMDAIEVLRGQTVSGAVQPNNETVNVVRCGSTADVLAKVASDPQAIGYDSLGLALKDSKVKALDYNDGGGAVKATLDNVRNGSYKLSRPFNIVYKPGTVDAGTNPNQAAFHEFLKSTQAQTVIANEGYVTTADGAAAYTAKAGLTPSTIKLWGSTSVTPLMIALADEFCRLQTGFVRNTHFTIGGSGSSAAYSADGAGTEGNFGMISSGFSTTSGAGMEYIELCKDGIAISVNAENTFTVITKAQLKGIYDKTADTKITKWSQIG